MTPITASMFTRDQNKTWEARMPILMLALIALGAFGLIGLLLVLAVSLEQKKIDQPSPHDRRVA